MIKKIAIFSILCAGLLAIAGIAVTRAAGDEPVIGYAWSDTTGWIDFQPSFGGVTYKSNSKQLKGYAWSDNVGWIYFGPEQSGNNRTNTAPENPKKWAELSGNTFVGWARACAGTVNGDCTGADRTDGWDGWIKMSDSNYGVTLNSNTGIIDGFAWGSEVVGWVSFYPTNDPLSDGTPSGGGSGGCGNCARITPQLGVALTANPASGNAPLASVLTATVTGDANGSIEYVFDCDGSGTEFNPVTVTSSQETQINSCSYNTPSTIYTATVNITRQGFTASDTAGVTTDVANTPSVTLNASTPVLSGQSSSLTWSSANTTGTCSASSNPTGGWSGSKALSGSESSNAITAQTTFTLSCSGPGGSASDSKTVFITVPEYTLSVVPTNITLTILSDEESGQSVESSSVLIKITNPTNGFNSNVSLSSNVSSIPGASGNFSDATLSQSEYGIGSTFSVIVPANTPPGTYTVRITATGGSPSVTRTKDITINSEVVDPTFRER